MEPAALGRFLPGVARRGRLRRAASTGWRRSSRSWRGCRCRRACWSVTSCRPVSAATTRACSTSWGPRGRWPGSASARWAGTMGGSCWCGPTGWRCARRGPALAARRPCRARSGTAWVRRPAGAGARLAGRRRAAASRTTRGWPPSCASTSRRAAPRSTATCSPRRCGARPRAAAAHPPSGSCSTRIWDLVWAGEVTNDTFLPLRALRWPRCGPRAAPPHARGSVRSGRMGPPEGAGRWSLVAEAVATAVAIAGGRPPTDTERRHALAMRLLDRHGVVTRDGDRDGGDPRGLRGGVRDPARAGGARPGPARLLRGRAGRRAVRAARRGGPAPLAARGPGWGPARATPARCCSPPRTRPTRTARRWPGRAHRDEDSRRVRASGGRVRGAPRRRAGALPGPRREVAPDAARVRGSGRPPWPPCGRSTSWSRTAACAAVQVERVDGVPVGGVGAPPAPHRRGLPARLPRLPAGRAAVMTRWACRRPAFSSGWRNPHLRPKLHPGRSLRVTSRRSATGIMGR